MYYPLLQGYYHVLQSFFSVLQVIAMHYKYSFLFYKAK